MFTLVRGKPLGQYGDAQRPAEIGGRKSAMSRAQFDGIVVRLDWKTTCEVSRQSTYEGWGWSTPR